MRRNGCAFPTQGTLWLGLTQHLPEVKAGALAIMLHLRPPPGTGELVCPGLEST